MNKFSLSTENEYKILFVIQQIQFIIRNFSLSIWEIRHSGVVSGALFLSHKTANQANKGLSPDAENIDLKYIGILFILSIFITTENDNTG